MALKLTFPNRLMFDRLKGFRTPELSLPFKALGDFSMLEREMAHRHGVSSNELFATLQDWEYTLKRSPSALAIIKGEKIPTSKVNETSSSQTNLVIWQAKSPAKYKRRPSRIAGG